MLFTMREMYVDRDPKPIPAAPAANFAADVLAEWNALYDAYNEVACFMLGSMTSELHRQFENYSPYDMLHELRSMFEKQAGVERFGLIQTFHGCKQKEGKSVDAYVVQMKGYVDQLERLGYVLPQDLDFAGFGLPKKAETPQVMMIKGGKIQKSNKKSLKAKGKGKANGKGKDKQVYVPKPKNPKPAAKEHPAKDDTCHHCKEVGHWKRNCPVYLAELLKKKKQVGSASSSGICTIELFAFPNKSWVYDTGCGTHICITKHGFRKARKLKQGSLYLYVGNGFRAQVEAIRSFNLVFPNGLVICFDNCHYAPSITRGVVLVHRLVENGFVQCFMDFRILVSKNNVFYFNVIPSNGIYEIDMHDLVPNVNSIYNVSTKRAKHNLDSTYLWHCCLAHISKKRIEKLQHEGLLKSTDGESFDQCVSCLSGKMTRKSFLHHPERATDLLGIIHTDVWGCEALVKRDTPDKLQQRSVKCIFIGYPKETMGYYFYFPPENKIVVARCTEFFEKNLITQEVSGRAIDLEEIQDEDTSPSEITSKISMEIDAMNAEIQSMIDNMVWVLVDLPHGCKTVGTKGYTQLYEVDYEETFSPVVDIRAIRILISIAAYYDYEIWQMDVKTAFLNGYLDEDIYMVQHEGFVDPDHPRKVCKLQRSIYGLKQASRSWNKTFDEEIKKFGFAQNLDEPCVYQKADKSNVTFLILYVDDIIIMGNHIPSLQSVKDYLEKCFAMKDLREAAFILGIKIYRDRSKRFIRLGQNAYMEKILKEI
nr:hypothetical protein [Tanacetum cinerariifolium]